VTSDSPPGLDDLNRRLALVSRAFSPSSPVTTKELFSGRTGQLNRLQDVIGQRGQHALIYGDRGVGKTSLARVIQASIEGDVLAPYFTCSSHDTFGSIWARALGEVRFLVQTNSLGFRPEQRETIRAASELLPEEPTPDDVRQVLSVLSRDVEVVLFIDEFDRPADEATRTLFADTVKILSDNGVGATIVLIGVASSVSELVAEHASVSRSLVQIQMPVMNQQESADIVKSGMRLAELDVEDGFVKRVVELSQGLPHYTHLIAQHGARHVVEDDRTTVTAKDSAPAVTLAVEDVSHSVRQKYTDATSSPRDTIYEDVLLACALARKDDIGEFGSGDLRGPLHRITGKNYEIPAYAAHLNAFSSDDERRGGVLRKRGQRARFRYRFVDPLMPPYVLMKGHSRDALP
jgi:Cdc6-like AAA superfamily ATPase